MVLQAIRNFDGYPKLRELGGLVPSLKPFKLNLAVRFLERAGTILIDGDGYIVWARGENNNPEMASLSDVAELSDEFREFLGKKGQ
ncbi:MAG TPA: hypothetical protein VJP79_02910 [Nitrososphaera sp.]|nr:hypothetical protein [Nitrososphaera sp.]